MEGESPVIDRNRVLDVKPFRRLVPVFPSNSQVPNSSPFYPFSGPLAAQLNHGTTHTPAPSRSFRPSRSKALVDDGGGGSRLRNARNSSAAYYRRKARMALSVVNDKFVVGLSLADREDGDREVVIGVLMRFDALRRRLSQLDDSEGLSGFMRRADLKAANLLMSKGVRTNMRKRIGAVPGVEIGDIYFFRMEMCVVGLHSYSMAGIDYMIVQGEGEEEPLAVSIVSSGVYDDEAEETNVLVYTGSGGSATADQKLEKGNLALERSSCRFNEIRVIRGVKDLVNPNSKVYVYDGLYRIQQSWVERGKSGGLMFKHKLVRIAGQPDAYAVWKSIDKWKAGLSSSRVGLILPDLTFGGENIPVPLVNDVDEEKGPSRFAYLPSVKYPKSVRLMESSYGCSCPTACDSGNLNCPCISKNGGDLPYTTNGVLVSRKPLIYECGNTCPCILNCKNRVSQRGLKVHVEVFKTKDRGWGLRTWDPIRAGTFICEYAGEVVDKATLGQNREEGEHDDYVFDTSRVYHSFKWNCEAGLIENYGSDDNPEEYGIPSPIFVSAKNAGNVARFMNHSCYPNTFWQPIAYEDNDDAFVHIAFFAMRHIPPMTELTYDYGTSHVDVTVGDNVQHGKKKCLCGSPKCRGYFG